MVPNFCIFSPTYCLGERTFPVSMKLFANNRKKLCKELKKLKNLPNKSVVLLQGGEQTQLHCTDRDVVFRQVCFNIFVIFSTIIIGYNARHLASDLISVHYIQKVDNKFNLG